MRTQDSDFRYSDAASIQKPLGACRCRVAGFDFRGVWAARRLSAIPKAPVEEWPTYGNDAGSSRFSPLTEITKENVRYLKVAWTYHTGDISEGTGTWNGQKVWAKSTFEATALMTEGTLYIATPFNRIIALDAETGKEKWTFDPKLNRIGYYGDDFTCRGLASRIDPQLPPGEACRKTIYEATLDGRLIAVDGETGKACAGFGTAGQVSLKAGINLDSGIDHVIPGEYHFTSAPAVVGDVVVVGSAINDNDRVEMPSGVVRGYNARTGVLVWAWDPVPRDPADPARATWQNGADRTGAANVWGPISADPAHDLVFLPTTSPSPDYFGGERKGDDRYADSVVALRASTGKVVWSFQAVHHNLWDYDLPSGPSLIEVRARRTSALRRSLSQARWATCSFWIATPASRCCRWKSGPCRREASLASGFRPPSLSRWRRRSSYLTASNRRTRGASRRGIVASAATRLRACGATASSLRRASRARSSIPAMRAERIGEAFPSIARAG